MVEIGRIDIACEVSILSSFSVMTRERHLDQLFHLFSYLKDHHNSRITFDHTYPNMAWEDFPKRSWKDYYGKVKEKVPEYCPRPLRK